MPYFLQIETATEVCSVSISQDYELISSKTASDPRVHTRKATLMIEDIMKAAEISYKDLSAVIISNGPGSYTGLRVGASLAKGLCFGLDIPLITVNTLESLFQASFDPHSPEKTLYIPMIDARRMEVYTAIYDQSKTCIKENEPLILDSDSFQNLLEDHDKCVFSGNGSGKFEEIVDNQAFTFTDIICDAVNLIQPGVKKYQNEDFADLAYFKPNYIKLPNITASKKKAL